jgi:hypothetical protein
MSNQSETIKSLAEALSKAQGKLEHAKKDTENPFFKSRYADLASVWDACRGALSENGIAVIQMPGQFEDGKVSLTTRLTHSSGEWIESTASAPVSKADAQGIGSCITYLRRYSLAAFVGVYQDDDDANLASAKKPAEEAQKPLKTKLNQNQVVDLYLAISEAGDMDVLKSVYATAYRVAHAQDDKSALDAFSKVYNERKTALEAIA